MKTQSLLAPLTRQAFQWLILAALFDWLVTRTITRSAIFMPKPPALLLLYQALGNAGQLALSLVSLLGLALLGAIAWWEWRRRRALWLAAAFGGQVGFSLLFLFVPPVGWPALANHLLYLVVIILVLRRAVSRQVVELAFGVGRLFPLLLPALAIIAGRLHQALPALYATQQWPGPPPLSTALFTLGELLVVLTPVGLWWQYGRSAPWRHWLLAGIPALFFVGVYLATPTMTGILTIWSSGITLYLPWPLYGISLWLAGVTFLMVRKTEEQIGWAVLLLAAGGFTPQLSAQANLALLALWLLTRPTVEFAGQPIYSSRQQNLNEMPGHNVTVAKPSHLTRLATGLLPLAE